MVCIYCKNQTAVVNSRLKKRSNVVWRRRKCLSCNAIFSTNETVVVNLAWVIQSKDKQTNNFNQDKLFISIVQCLKHRPTHLEDARNITDYVISKIMTTSHDSQIKSELIKSSVLVCLNRFDKTAYTYYKAFHK